MRRAIEESMRAVTAEMVRKVYPKRDQWSHKGDSGRVLVIGGSRRYRGAPALVGLAALRTGADIAVIAAPESSADVVSSFSPNLITEPLEGDYINPDNVKRLLSIAENFDSVVIGNGMGRMSKSMDAVICFLKAVQKPCVIDGDGLHLLAGNKSVLRPGWIITPHAHEFYSLSGIKLTKSVEERMRHTEKFSGEFKATVLLKGHKDVISEGKASFINSTGNPYMTVGGTGDVLAGICGALLAMKLKAIDAAAAGAYLSGAAGDIAARRTSPGMLATDVIDRIPDAIRSVLD